MIKATVEYFPGATERTQPHAGNTSKVITGRPHPWNSYFYGTEFVQDGLDPNNKDKIWLKTVDGGYVAVDYPNNHTKTL